MRNLRVKLHNANSCLFEVQFKKKIFFFKNILLPHLNARLAPKVTFERY